MESYYKISLKWRDIKMAKIMKPLRDYFSLRQEFSYTILNPIDRCIEQLDTEPSGCINLSDKVSYEVSRESENHYHVIARNQEAHLEAELTSKDRHKTVVHGWVKPTKTFTSLLMILVMSIFCLFVLFKIALDTNVTSALKMGLILSGILSLFMVIILLFGKLDCNRMKRKFLDTISATEPEKKKKHA